MSIDTVNDAAVERVRNGRTFALFSSSNSCAWYTGNSMTASMELTKQQYMDLISAQREAKDSSRKEKKKLYFINIDDEGECSVSNELNADTSAYCYRNGAEVALPTVEAAPTKSKQSKTTSADANASNMKTAKKGTKKGAAKKAARRTVSAELAELHKRRTAGGKKMDITIGQMEKNTKAGKVFYKDPQGVAQSLNYLKSRVNKDFVRKGMFEFKVEAAK